MGKWGIIAPEKPPSPPDTSIRVVQNMFKMSK
jgi:hypothetical protein